VHNISGSVGISIATVFAVSLLSMLILTNAAASPVITPEIIDQLNFDNVNFLTNDQVEDILANRIGANPEEVAKAVLINAEARLRALKISLLGLAALALLAIVPAGRMPGFRDEDLPVGYPDQAAG